MKKLFLPLIILHISFVASGQEKKLPIIDMHLHAFSVSESVKGFKLKDYKNSQTEYESLTIAELKKHNIIAYASGPLDSINARGSSQQSFLAGSWPGYIGNDLTF